MSISQIPIILSKLLPYSLLVTYAFNIKIKYFIKILYTSREGERGGGARGVGWRKRGETGWWAKEEEERRGKEGEQGEKERKKKNGGRVEGG